MNKKLLVCLSVIVVLAVVGMFTFTKSSKANELTSENSRGINVVTDTYTDEWSEPVEKFEDMVPVFTALGAQIFDDSLGYHQYRRFYKKSFSYLVPYAKNMLQDNITEDDKYYYISERDMKTLSTLSFVIGDMDCIKQQEKLSDYISYDSDNNVYIVKKKDVPMDYSLTITSVKGSQHVDNGRFEEVRYFVNAKLYKSGEYIDDLVIEVWDNDNYMNGNIKYGIKNINEVNNNFEIE